MTNKNQECMVMNETTWEMMQEVIFERANKMNDPIDYIHKLLSAVNIYHDNSLHDGIIEYWDEETYLKVRDEDAE